MAIKKRLKNKNNRGNIAIIVAISLTVLIGFLALVIDGGWLYASKNKWQNGVEAAALAGAIHLCDDPEGIARQIAQKNGVPSTTQEGLTVKVGYYDEADQHDDFSVYKDFVAEGDADYPAEEYNNAVMVSLNADVSTFLAGIFGKEKVAVSAKAVAYAERYGMLALGDSSEIHIGPRVTIKNGAVYSNGNIKHTETASCTSTWSGNIYTYLGPQFENANLYAHNQVLECDTSCSGSTLVVDWNSGTQSSRGNASSGAPEFTGVEPCDDAYIDSLKDSADVIYEPGDAGSDTIFYGTKNYGGKVYYCFDLCASDGERTDRVVYFFDAEDNGSHGVWLHEAYPRHGEYIQNITFITKLPVRLDYDGEHHVGADGEKQFILITSKDLEVAGFYLYLEGATFRIGGSFSPCYGSHILGSNQKARIIADGDINLWRGSIFSNGSWTGTIDFNFGPPCPPIKVGLGKLVPAGG